MDKRVVQIIRYIADHPGVSQKTLAETFGLSARTVRSHIASARDELGEDVARITLERGSGYRVEVVDAKRFEQAASAEVGGGYPSSREERVDYLLTDLLSRTDWVTLDELSNVLYISRRTISEDLREVEQILGHFNLSIERRPYHGMRVVGSELSRRICMAHSVLKDVVAGVSDAEMDGMLDMVDSCVSEVLEAHSFPINQAAHHNLLVHIAVAILRIRSNSYVPMDDAQLSQIRQGGAYPVARDIALRVGSELATELPESEIAYIALHLSGKGVVMGDEGSCHGSPVITDEVWDIANSMIDVVWREFHFDFRGDVDLAMSLAQHIVPLTVRLKYRMGLENPLLANIKDRFPVSFAMATVSCQVISERCDAVLSEDEIGYIAMLFELALERHRDGMPKKTIAMVCASGAGTARLLEYRYQRELGDYVEKIITCSPQELQGLDFSNIDYVFTTVPLTAPVPVPVREVTLFLDSADAESIRQLLSEPCARRDVLTAFDERLFLPHLEAKDKHEAIRALTAAAGSVYDMPEEFEHLVWEREQLAPTSFGAQIALPHPIRPVGPRTFVAVGLLDEPVNWDGKDVSAVFLLCIAEGGERESKELVTRLAKMFLDSQRMDRIIAERRLETLLDCLV